MKDRITVFLIYITIKIPLRFFAFRHPVVAQLKAEVNGKNCTSLRMWRSRFALGYAENFNNSKSQTHY